jgi:RNA polymerase primary sigma factor
MPTIASTRRVTRAPQQAELRHRADRLLRQSIAYIANPGFARLSLSAVELPSGPILREEPAEKSPRRTRLSALFRAPLLRPEMEQALFRRMNFLKYRATRRRSLLNPARPQKSLIAEVEWLLAQAESCRTTLVQSNLRLVAAIAGRLAGALVDFEELVSEGNVILLHAVDKFDFSRGFRFSTYATNAIQRHFYRLLLRRQRSLRRERLAETELLSQTVAAKPEPEASDVPLVSRETLEDWMSGLESRDRSILVARFGLDASGEARTLRSLSSEVGLSKERIRQLQFRALDKLRACIPASLLSQAGAERCPVSTGCE